MPIPVPQGVKVNIAKDGVTVTGPKGELSRRFNPDIAIARDNDNLIVSRPSDSKEHRSLHGLTRSLLANMVSYARLAGVAVAKGATASAFNSMLIPWAASGGIVGLVIGGFFLILSHLVVFVLGAISSGIQAIRLNYVEFFLKFFKGNGIRFKPFGKASKKHDINNTDNPTIITGLRPTLSENEPLIGEKMVYTTFKIR